LSVSGENLKCASLIIWSEGSIQRVQPLRSDNTKMQAVVPKNMEKSMMIIWPENENGIGLPQKVNAPVIWFDNRGYLRANEAVQTIRFFGKSFYFEGKTPAVVIERENKTEAAEITDINPYQVTVRLDFSLKDGEECKFYIHNGTGGELGWSNAVTLKAVQKSVKDKSELPVISVDDYGAVADDGKDDSDAIKKAIDAAAKLGGAVLEFGQGEYNFSKPIKIPDSFPLGLYIKGKGKGIYDFASKLLPFEYEHRGLSGEFTSLRFLGPLNAPENMIFINADNVYLSDLTIFGADGHTPDGYSMDNGFTVYLLGRNISIENVRMIKADVRDFNTSPDAELMCNNHIYVAPASQNIDINNCEFHTKACAIWINAYDYVNNEQSILFSDKRQVKYVNISNCNFYSYTTPYVHPDGRKPVADEGEVSRGLTVMNCSSVIVENCNFEGVDQEKGFVLTRTMYIPITANCMYIANNTMKNVGSVPKTEFDGNTGEQILFHGGMHLGGIYNVLKSDGNRLTVRTDNITVKDENGKYIRPDTTITNAGSRIQYGLKEGTRGMAFICSGKGIGQICQINSYDVYEDNIVFHLAEPWITEPDETSIVVETAPFRENIVYKNIIYKEKPTMAQGFKSGGVLMFFDSYSNIIAENKFSNLAFGVALNTAFKAPLSWNTVRDNEFSGIAEAYKDAMQGGDSTRNSTFFCESVVGNAGETAGWDSYNIWYTVGNVFRNNNCFDGDTAAELATNRWHNLYNKGLEDYHGNEKGNTLTVIENNTFKDVADGVLIGNPAYWSLIRNNKYTPKVKEGYGQKTLINDHPLENFDLLYIDEKEIIDVNKTLNISDKGEKSKL